MIWLWQYCRQMLLQVQGNAAQGWWHKEWKDCVGCHAAKCWVLTLWQFPPGSRTAMTNMEWHGEICSGVKCKLSSWGRGVSKDEARRGSKEVEARGSVSFGFSLMFFLLYIYPRDSTHLHFHCPWTQGCLSVFQDSSRPFCSTSSAFTRSSETSTSSEVTFGSKRWPARPFTSFYGSGLILS